MKKTIVTLSIVFLIVTISFQNCGQRIRSGDLLGQGSGSFKASDFLSWKENGELFDGTDNTIADFTICEALVYVENGFENIWRIEWSVSPSPDELPSVIFNRIIYIRKQVSCGDDQCRKVMFAQLPNPLVGIQQNSSGNGFDFQSIVPNFEFKGGFIGQSNFWNPQSIEVKFNIATIINGEPVAYDGSIGCYLGNLNF